MGAASARNISTAFQPDMYSRSINQAKLRIGIIVLPLKMEHLQAIVSRIDRDDASTAIDGGGPGISELADLAAGNAPGGDPAAALFVDQLHAIVPKFGHHQMSALILIQSIWETELAKSRANAANMAEEGAVGSENGKAVIARVGDVEDVIVDHHRL